MIFQQITVDGKENFGYYLCDESENVAAFVDPSYTPEKFLVIAKEMGAEVLYVINTHSHKGHANGNKEVLKQTKAKLVGYGVKGRRVIPVKNESTLMLGQTELTFYHTPGHTKDSICVLADKNLITGDTLFVGAVGSTENQQEAQTLYDTLHNLMDVMPDDVNIFPGHDKGVRPFSTIRYEKDNNPFLNTQGFKEFMFLRQYWAKKEQMHQHSAE